jgi:hypothetical protein
MKVGIGIAIGVTLMLALAGGAVADESRVEGPAVAATAAASGRWLAPGDVLEVIAPEIPLRRDAISIGGSVGWVSRGERVRYVDAIDRRLRVFNVTVFDGGFWVRVRAANGSEGWLRAETVREAR